MIPWPCDPVNDGGSRFEATTEARELNPGVTGTFQSHLCEETDPTIMYDFAVVGVGPPGARFARRAAEAGYEVLALEKGRVGKPLACSGHVSTDIWDYVPEMARDRLFQNRISGARFHTGGPDSQSYPFYKDSEISNVIDRVELDRTLADCAREAGAEVREGHTVTGMTEHEDHVRLDVSLADDLGADTGLQNADPGGTAQVTARMVAGCDGPNSKVRSEAGLPEPDELLHGVLAFESEPDHGDRVDVHLTAPEFFAWRIPRGNAGTEYGLGAPPGTDVSAMFGRLTDEYDVTTANVCSGVIPVGPPSEVTGRRTFLIGDAAAQTKPFTGGGILYGMTAADIAAAEIDPREPASLERYETAWREDLSREIQLGHWLRRCYSLPKPIQQFGLRTLSGEIGVHMDRPSTLFSREQLKQLFS